MTGYTPTTEEVREAISEWAWARRMFRPELGQSDGLEADRWLAAHDAEVQAQVVAEEPEGDDEPCKAEIWSWDIFRHQEVDPYWMRCHRIGAHDKHENSETGATWPVKQEGAETDA